MKRNIIVYGIIAGILLSTFMLVTTNFASFCNGNVGYNTSMVLGYASMLIAFSLVYVGIRNYRDKYNGGVISFGKAFKIGLLMVLIASTIYVVAWLIDNYYFIPDFSERFSAHMLEKLKADGATQAELDKEAAKMADYAQLVKNPIFNALFTYVLILPAGLAVALISSLILKKKTR